MTERAGLAFATPWSIQEFYDDGLPCWGVVDADEQVVCYSMNPAVARAVMALASALIEAMDAPVTEGVPAPAE